MFIGDMTGGKRRDGLCFRFKLISADADTLTFKGLVLIFYGETQGLRTEFEDGR